MDILAAAKLNDKDSVVEEPPQPSRGNKISKKNKKKNKKQDFGDDSAGIYFFHLFIVFIAI